MSQLPSTNVNPQIAALPAHLQQAIANQSAGSSVANVMQYVSPPRMRIVQGLSKPEIRALFVPGDVYCSPSNQLIAANGRDARQQPAIGPKCGTPFFISPIFQFTEFLVWNPREMAEQGLSMIRDRSLALDSDIARIARDKNLRESYACPEDRTGKLFLRYQEHLNFIVNVCDGDLFGTPMILSFVRGEFKSGIDFCNLIQGLSNVGRSTLELYARIYKCQVGYRDKGPQKQWYGIDVTTPLVSDQMPAFAEADLYEWLEGQYNRFRSLHESRQLQGAQDDDAVDPGTIDGKAVNVNC